jgi:3-deoxy-D-arabino-heptulosonate 7-phosphate (DAHP) synthase
VTEAIDVACVALVERYADTIQIGARHAELLLLKRAGRSRLPVLLKRMSATIEELLLAAERIVSEGNATWSFANAACAPSPTIPATRSTSPRSRRSSD